MRERPAFRLLLEAGCFFRGRRQTDPVKRAKEVGAISLERPLLFCYNRPVRSSACDAADRDDRDVRAGGQPSAGGPARAGGAAEGAVRPQQSQAQAQQEGSKWAPVLICAVWLFLAFKMSRDNGGGDILTRVQNGDYQLLLFVAAPIIAALFVCAKGAPKFLHGLGAVVLGIAAGYNFVVSLYWLDMSVLKMDLVFGSSTVGTILTVLISFIALFVAIAAGGECKKIGE